MANTAPSRPFLDASGITFLLSDHEKFGFSERLTYHFDLIETLTSIPQKPQAASPSDGNDEKDKCEGIQISNLGVGSSIGEGNDSLLPTTATKTMDPRIIPKKVCGVVALLECVSAQTSRQKNQRRHLFRRIKEFNRRANKVRDMHSNCPESDSCYAPPKLPLHLSFTTRVAFVYELTRMVLCIDASPTLTATFGNLKDNAVCAMDRLENMVRIYFKGLMEPIVGANVIKGAENSTNAVGQKSNATSWWTPEIAITVIAVYPRAIESNDVETLSVLVQDYRVHDAVSASILSDKVADWATLEVESGIASRLSRTGNHLDSSTSSLRRMVEACDIALGTLPSEGRPCIVLATDCRGVDCDSMLDLVQDQNLLDKPLYVLDLSGSTSHETRLDHNDTAWSMDELSSNEPNYLMFDNDGPSTFPLCFPDDSEALYYACKAMRGCFFDEMLLRSASSTRAGKVPIDSPFYSDTYFSKERKMQPNALQWYTFFSLSPCCPRYSPLGEVPPPLYIQEKRQHSIPKISQGKPMFLTYYSLSPVRVKGIIIMRIMDGYRLKKYGYNSSDGDKVSIHFTLPLESGVVIHYELSYVAFPNHNPMVGSANVKILVSGNPDFVQLVKDEFALYQFNLKKPVLSVKQQACDKICRFLNWQKNEDKLESELCPLEWGGIISEGSLFLSHLKGLNRYQRYRHFRMDSFEVALTGNVCISTEPPVSEFMELDNGENQLSEVMNSWSSCMIKEGNLYIKRLPSAAGNLTSYCLLEVTKSVLARIFTVHLLFFEQVDTNVRLYVALSLKMMLSSCSELVLAPRLFSKCVVSRRRILMEAMYHHERWELLPDPELVPLLSKRRSQFGKYVLVEDGIGYAMFVKFFHDEKGRSYLVQYHIQTFPNRVTVEMVMDWPRGEFCGMQSNSRASCSVSASSLRPASLFAKIYEKVKNRDQKCGRALRSRRNLLSVFEGNSFTRQYPGDQAEDVERLLAYSSKSCIKLRFFEILSGEANEILADLTISLLLSNSFDANVVKLSISQDVIVGGTEPGTWLLLRHDSHVLTFIHLPFHEQVSEVDDNDTLFVYREVTFFTASIGGLYYTQDDLADDDSIERDETEHECVVDVADALENAHGRNYALAAYLALRHRSSDKLFSFTDGDFEHVLNQCTETKITSHGVDVTKEDGPKLATLITDIQLSPVPGGGPYFFYSGNEESCHKDSLDDEIISLDSDLHGNEEVCDVPDEELSDSLPTFNINNTDRAFGSTLHSDGSLHIIRNYSVLPPLFIKFDLDCMQPVTSILEDIGRCERNCALNAYITIFDDSKGNLKQRTELDIGTLPTMHAAVVMKLVSRLNSFVAEQTLENLRREGMTLSNIDIVKKCLLEAENVACTTVPLHFYVAKTDSMLDASIPTVVEGGLNRQFVLLCLYIETQNDIPMKRMPEGVFFAIDTEISGWCYIDVPKAFGFGLGLSIYVYHPAGKERAQCIAMKAQLLVSNISHRVNQTLLLENLHKTRTASSLLIPSGAAQESSPASTNVEESSSSHYQMMHSKALYYPPGHFQCPTSYQTSYMLNRRCTMSQTIIQLESSVLHNFAVSNRSGLFVYKDEEGLIFYMKLQSCQGGDHVILLVYGEQKAGPSITEQLNRILEKKIMSLTLEVISGVLTNNCRYNLRPTDISFLHSFQKVWSESVQTEETLKDEKIYEFPSSVYDPVIVLLYFRQNISGSTFFNILNEASTESEGENIRVEHCQVPATMKDDTDCTSNGVLFTLNHREFSLCFNASQFQLDPNLQPVSTLTNAGVSFAQQAGTGVALVEIKLLHFNNEQVDKVCIGLTPQKEVEPLQIPIEFLRFRKIGDEGAFAQHESVSKFRLSVRIINTTVNTDVVHKWIELTLNQALLSWSIERHLEKASLSLFISRERICETKQCMNTDGHGFGNPYCGLSGLCSILHSSIHLPHPGMQKLTFQGSVRATMLAKLASNLLERGLIQSLFNDKRLRVSDVVGLKIIRFCGKDTPKEVRFSCDSENSVVHVFDIVNNCQILDGSADSPEYVAVFGLSPETEKMRRIDNENHRKSQLVIPPSSFLFRNVSIEDHLNDQSPDSLSEALIKLTSSSPYAFFRRMAFVLTVTRSSQSVLLYNWNPQTKQSAHTRLKEVHEDFLLSYNQKLISLQSRSLKDVSLIESLSPHALSGDVVDKTNNIGVTTGILKRSPSESAISLHSNSKNHRSSHKNDISREKMRRTSSILMPTIVGKSVKGSDMQALAMARARAKAPRTSGSRTKVSSTNTSISSHLKAQGHKTRDSSSLQKVKLSSLRESKQRIFLEHISSSLLKEYCALQNHLSSTILLRNTAIHTTQNLLIHRMTHLKGKELSVAAMDFILTHGNLVQTQVFSLIQAAVINPTPFIMYLNKSISRSEGLILSKNFTNQTPQISKVLYTMNKIADSKYYTAYLIHEIVVFRHPTKGLMGRCRSWLFTNSKANGHETPVKEPRVTSRKSRKRKNSLVNREWESLMINTITCVAITRALQICRGAVFNFVSILLRRTANKQSIKMGPLNVPLLLRESMAIFPARIQIRVPQLCYRLLHNELFFHKSELLIRGSWFSIQDLIDSMSRRQSMYSIVKCNGDQDCFAGLAPGKDSKYLFIPYVC